MTAVPSLRQRKKDQTRARLLVVAGRLFAEQGYEATTLEQICAEAEVSVPTLLTYFESKERLRLAPDYARLEVLRAALEDPARRQSTVEIWKTFTAEGAQIAAGDPSWLAQRLDDRPPALARGYLALLSEYQRLLARGLAADFGVDPSKDLATVILSGALSYSTGAVLRAWLAEGCDGDLVARASAVIDGLVERLPQPGQPWYGEI